MLGVRRSYRMIQRPRYREHNNKICIDIYLRHWQQLFDSRDPSPFRERDLDDDAVTYIVSSFQEISSKAKTKLVICLPSSLEEEVDRKMIIDAIHSFFAYERELNRKKAKEILRIGQVAFVIGVIALSVFAFASHFLSRVANDEEGWVEKFVYEGLNLLGWVAMWHPLNIFLYSWWPHLRADNIYSYLENIEIDFYFTPAAK